MNLRAMTMARCGPVTLAVLLGHCNWEGSSFLFGPRLGARVWHEWEILGGKGERVSCQASSAGVGSDRELT